MHDKLTIPTSLTLNEASGCWATTDDITSWFSFIVWQDVVLFVLEVAGVTVPIPDVLPLMRTTSTLAQLNSTQD